MKENMGGVLARLLQSFLNLFGSKSKDLRLQSPQPKDEIESATSREIRLPTTPKNQWEKFMHQPNLTEADLNSSSKGGRRIKLEYIDPNPYYTKYVLVALASFNWEMAKMIPSKDTEGKYKLNFINPTRECIFKFVVNDKWMTSDKYKITTDETGNQNNYI